MIIFESEKHFNQAVFDYLAENLTVQVRMVSDGDYYNPGKVPEVVIKLGGAAICDDRAW